MSHDLTCMSHDLTRSLNVRDDTTINYWWPSKYKRLTSKAYIKIVSMPNPNLFILHHWMSFCITGCHSALLDVILHHWMSFCITGCHCSAKELAPKTFLRLGSKPVWLHRHATYTMLRIFQMKQKKYNNKNYNEYCKVKKFLYYISTYKCFFFACFFGGFFLAYLWVKIYKRGTVIEAWYDNFFNEVKSKISWVWNRHDFEKKNCTGLIDKIRCPLI